MNQKLIRIALITSPLIAIYGIAPILLIYEDLGISKLLVAFVALALSIFAFWLYNIFLIGRALSTSVRYLLSYSLTFTMHLGTLFIISNQQNLASPLYFSLYAVMATFASNTIILVIIHSSMIRTKKDLAEAEVQQLKVVNLEAQKKILVQQLQPHFLFNALSTLKSLITTLPEQATDYCIRLSEFLRYSINMHLVETVSLKEELQFAQDYIQLQKVRFDEALICEVAIPERYWQRKIPAFALQTLLENAIKHNFFTVQHPLVIQLKMEDDRIVITNNKTPKPLFRSPGIGLQNLNERYQLHFGKPIEIVDADDRFSVYLSLPEV
ncbi:MAG: histidine kinase [Bacteroidota bacterium]